MGILSIKYVTGNKLALDTCRNIEKASHCSALELSQDTGISSKLLRVKAMEKISIKSNTSSLMDTKAQVMYSTLLMMKK